jgi:hypothetical protein
MRARATSHNQIAAKLNECNVKTARGGRWTQCAGRGDPVPFRRKRRRVKAPAQ